MLAALQVFAKAGLESPVIGSIIVGSVNVAGTMLAAVLMDRAGRRQLLLSSHTFMAICLTALSVSTFLPREFLPEHMKEQVMYSDMHQASTQLQGCLPHQSVCINPSARQAHTAYYASSSFWLNPYPMQCLCE